MNMSALLRVFVASLARRRLATALSVLAIALGVALGLAVQLIHASALDEFGRGMRLLAGQSDLQAVGPRGGFDDETYVRLGQAPEVAEASPVLEIEARLAGREGSLRLYGIDVFRLAGTTPRLLPQSADGVGRLAVLEPDRVFLSAAARVELGLEAGDVLEVLSGVEPRRFTVSGGVPAAAQGEAFGVIDIAAAQSRFGRVGKLTRVDLRLAPGLSVEAARERLAPLLPAGVELLTPDEGAQQAAGLSRAYRVNMAMLAAIALLTGGFLVFSAQWLAVVRRRSLFAFLRAMGMTRAMVLRGLVLEGAAIGLLGGLIGVALAHVFAAAAFALIGADLGAGFFAAATPQVSFRWLPAVAYLALGVVVGAAGAWLPAREAVRRAPARALHAGDEAEAWRGRPRGGLALACAGLALLLCWLPPVGGIPLAGYAAVALVLVSAVLVLPAVVVWMVSALSPLGGVIARLVRLRLAAAPGQAVVAGAGVVASVALAVSMAVMVSSFRVSLDDWLARVLPADVYVRASPSSQSGFLPPELVRRVAALPEVAEVIPLRYDTLRMGDGRFPMTLIARPADGGAALPLVVQVAVEGPAVWLSEAAADLLARAPGDRLTLPLAGGEHVFVVGGVWRDYARQHGALVIERDDWQRITGDTLSNDLGVSLAPGISAAQAQAAIVAALDGAPVEFNDAGSIRATSLEIFDRTFVVTWLMEAVAVLIGLFGIVTTFAALALARAREFGVLRHLGLERRRIGTLLAAEGALTALAGVAAGVVAGLAIALILVFVINRQSFHWSMDLAVPWGMVAVFAGVLVTLAALAARLAGRSAMRQEAVLAVKEDW